MLQNLFLSSVRSYSFNTVALKGDLPHSKLKTVKKILFKKEINEFVMVYRTKIPNSFTVRL